MSYSLFCIYGHLQWIFRKTLMNSGFNDKILMLSYNRI
jgi:hypothetical protein